jgi:hypothetical protein
MEDKPDPEPKNLISRWLWVLFAIVLLVFILLPVF